MAGRIPNPFLHWVNSAGAPYAGGTLTFYAAGTSDPLDTYSDQSLSTLNANPLTLNSAGRPSVAIFLQNLPYKVVLKDSSGNEIWTADPVSATDLASVTITKTGSGNPNGSVAGTAGSAGVLATEYWDYTNRVLYRCVVTGNAATAEWVAINAQAATPTVTAPQGYLTLVSTAPIIAADVSAATAVYYTPFDGNLIPIYNGSRMVPTEFSELTLTLVSQHAASTIYDVFVFSNAGVLTLVTGPAWSASTAGAGVRGTGAGTSDLTLLNGYWVNEVQISARNGAITYTVGANLATYVGSIFIDGSAGQLTCHRSFGQARKWGVWNYYNRQPIILKGGASTASWSYNTATIRASNGDSNNKLTVFSGGALEFYELAFSQTVKQISSNSAEARNGIGWNSTTVMSGFTGSLLFNPGGSAHEVAGNLVARHMQAPALGINDVTALENASDPAGTSTTWFGGEDDFLLTARWMG